MSASDSLILSVFFTLSLFISVSSVNFVSNNLTLSVSEWVMLEETVLLVYELGLSSVYPYWIWATPGSCRSTRAHKPTWHSHEFWVTVLQAHAVRMYVIRCNSGVNAPMSQWITLDIHTEVHGDAFSHNSQTNMDLKSTCTCCLMEINLWGKNSSSHSHMHIKLMFWLIDFVWLKYFFLLRLRYIYIYVDIIKCIGYSIDK